MGGCAMIEGKLANRLDPGLMESVLAQGARYRPGAAPTIASTDPPIAYSGW